MTRTETLQKDFFIELADLCEQFDDVRNDDEFCEQALEAAVKLNDKYNTPYSYRFAVAFLLALDDIMKERT